MCHKECMNCNAGDGMCLTTHTYPLEWENKEFIIHLLWLVEVQICRHVITPGRCLWPLTIAQDTKFSTCILFSKALPLLLMYGGICSIYYLIIVAIYVYYPLYANITWNAKVSWYMNIEQPCTNLLRRYWFVPSDNFIETHRSWNKHIEIENTYKQTHNFEWPNCCFKIQCV